MLTDISKTLRHLERLAQCKAPITKPSRRAHAKIYSRIRKDAIDLYDTLLETFRAQRNCRCSPPHNANLRLERIPKQKLSNSSSPRFCVLLSFDVCSDKQSESLWTWREIEFQPLDDHTGPKIARKDTDIHATTPALLQVVAPTPDQAPAKPVERRRDILRGYVKNFSFQPSVTSRSSSPPPPIQM